MARFDVVLQDAEGSRRNCRLLVDASSASEALVRARASMGAAGVSFGPGCRYAVFKHRRGRRRALVGYFLAPGDGDDGSAGVREPRRPLPAPPSLRAEESVPAAAYVGLVCSC
jgi:hypothetical protein